MLRWKCFGEVILRDRGLDLYERDPVEKTTCQELITQPVLRVHGRVVLGVVSLIAFDGSDVIAAAI